MNWNEIDKDVIVAVDYYCAFIDILGYKDKVERYFNGVFNLEGRFNRALANATSLMRLSAVFVEAQEIQIRFFSDSIILLLPKSDKTQSQLFSLIHFCSILSAHLSFEDLFVRGGISLGRHKESQNENGANFLASIALQKAYLLESRHSINPRILIDEELILQCGPNERTIIAKEGGECFVHFSPNVINSEGKNTEEVLKEMLDIADARKRSPDNRAADKYTWILDYYYWTLSLVPNIDMAIFSDFAPVQPRDFSRW